MMKLLLSFLLVACAGTHCMAMSIGIGFISDKAVFWRFWEINKDGVPEPKILVYNTSSEGISFALYKTKTSGRMDSVDKARLYKKVHLTSDTVVSAVSIPPHQYGVYAIAADRSGYYDAVFVNGKACGIDDDLRKLPAIEYTHKYYSYDAVSGSNSYLIAKDNLISRRGKKDYMILYADYTSPKNDPYLKYNRLELEKTTGFRRLTATVEGGGTYSADSMTKDRDLHIDAVRMPKFEVAIAFTVARRGAYPVLDMRTFFASGGAGWRMPVFVLK